jgi:hypothetical protein
MPALVWSSSLRWTAVSHLSLAPHLNLLSTTAFVLSTQTLQARGEKKKTFF